MQHVRNSAYTGKLTEVLCANCHEVFLRPREVAKVIPFLCSDMCKRTYAVPMPTGSPQQDRARRAQTARPTTSAAPATQQPPTPGRVALARVITVRYSTELLAPQPQSAGSLMADTVRCPQCGANVQGKKLESHLQRRCPRRPPARPYATATASPHPGRLEPTGRTRADVFSGAPLRTPQLPADLRGVDPRDGSRGWSQAFREHGRFGSFPVHDNYGDESEA